MQGCQQQNPHHLYDVWEHTVRAVSQVPAEPVLRWAMLLHEQRQARLQDRGRARHRAFPGISQGEPCAVARLLPRLRFSSADTERILLLVERHDTAR